MSNAEKAASREGPSQVAGGHRQFSRSLELGHLLPPLVPKKGKQGGVKDGTVCTQLQCIMSNNVVVVSKSDAGVDMKGLGFKL